MSYPSRTDFDNLKNSLPLTYQTRGNYAFRTDLASNINTALKNVNSALANYALKNDLPVVPANVATKTDLAGYALKSDIPVVPSNVATKSDLGSYALVSDLNRYQPAGKYVSPSDLENYQPKGDYVVGKNLAEYAKTSELAGFQPKGDYAAKADLAAFQPKGDYAVNASLANFQPRGEYALSKDLANYQQKGDYAVNSSLSNFQPKGDYAVKTDLSGYQPKGDYALNAALANFQQKGDYAAKTDLASYQPKGDYATKTDLATYQSKGDYAAKTDLANYASKVSANDFISAQYFKGGVNIPATAGLSELNGPLKMSNATIGNLNVTNISAASIYGYQTAGNYVLSSEYTTLKNSLPLTYQTAGNYVLSSEYTTLKDNLPKTYQPVGNYQTAGNYVLKTEFETLKGSNTFTSQAAFNAGFLVPATAGLSSLNGPVEIQRATGITTNNLFVSSGFLVPATAGLSSLNGPVEIQRATGITTNNLFISSGNFNITNFTASNVNSINLNVTNISAASIYGYQTAGNYVLKTEFDALMGSNTFTSQVALNGGFLVPATAGASSLYGPVEIQRATGITTNNLFISSGNFNITNFTASNVNSTNLNVTNISAASGKITTLTVGTLLPTLISGGSLSMTGISGSNLSVSGSSDFTSQATFKNGFVAKGGTSTLEGEVWLKNNIYFNPGNNDSYSKDQNSDKKVISYNQLDLRYAGKSILLQPHINGVELTHPASLGATYNGTDFGVEVQLDANNTTPGSRRNRQGATMVLAMDGSPFQFHVRKPNEDAQLAVTINNDKSLNVVGALNANSALMLNSGDIAKQRINFGDGYHGIARDTGVNGPSVFGYEGGILRSTGTGDSGDFRNDSLRWHKDGITVNKDLVVNNGGITVTGMATDAQGHAGLYKPNKDGVFIGGINGFQQIQMNADNGSYIDFAKKGEDMKGRILYESRDNQFRFYTNETEQMKLDKDGTLYVKKIVVGDKVIINSNGITMNDTYIRFRGENDGNHGMQYSVDQDSPKIWGVGHVKIVNKDNNNSFVRGDRTYQFRNARTNEGCLDWGGNGQGCDWRNQNRRFVLQETQWWAGDWGDKY